MSFNRRKRNALGPRFGEIMGKRCHAAITAANRLDREAYDREVADIHQMLDTIETETWKQEDEPTPVEVQPAPVAAEVKPTAKRKRPAKKDTAGAGKSKRASGKAPRADAGTVSDGSFE